MQPEPQWMFGPFRLDPGNACVWCGAQGLPLKPKSFAVLRYLVAHAGQLVTKEALFKAVWPDVAVGDAVLKVCIGEIRKALGDTPKTPHFIATAHRRGYRFIAPVHQVAPGETSHPVSAPDDALLPYTSPLSHRSSAQPPVSLLERDGVLHRLQAALGHARAGARQVVFVTGEPGIGKTTVVEAFLAQAASDPHLWTAKGQCIDHYGPGEPYLPVLEALSGLCKDPGAEQAIDLLLRQAPTWVVQMPWLMTETEVEALQRRVSGATQERMLREMGEAMTAITAERPLILVLEDLHWSDHATTDLLAWLARRQATARLLIVGTYRPSDLRVHGHPLQAVVQELKMQRRAEELPLTALTEAAVDKYLTTRVSAVSLPDGLARLLHQRTEGNPLFMVNVVDAWKVQGLLETLEGEDPPLQSLEELVQEVPESLRHMLVAQLERLSAEDLLVLEAASAAGVEFSTLAVAAAVDLDVGEAEMQCERLARRQQWLRGKGVDEWPDGTIAGRYAFIHAFYQQTVYEHIAPARRVLIHRRIAEREEVAYGQRASEIAVELAAHFEQGRDYRRAVHYLWRAGEQAIRRCANREAIRLLTKGLELLATLPDTPERAQQELSIQIALGVPLRITRGSASPEVEQVYARARGLSQEVGEVPQLFPALWGLWGFYTIRGHLLTARELSDRLLKVAQSTQEDELLLEAYHAQWSTAFWRGELAVAHTHATQGIALYDRREHRSLAFRYGGHDPGVCCRDFGALVLWLMGYADQAQQRSQEALALARELSHPYTLAEALGYAAWLWQFRREGAAVREMAEAVTTLAQEEGFAYWSAQGRILKGWALAEQGQGRQGIPEMRQGIADHRTTGSEAARPYYLGLLAEAYRGMAQPAEGLNALHEALEIVHEAEVCFYAAELHRLQGELLLIQAAVREGGQSVAIEGSSGAGVEEHAYVEAEACYHRALDIACCQQTKMLELRAAISLSRLWRHTGRRQEARRLLAGIYGWFTEGFETADLQEAGTLLAELA